MFNVYSNFKLLSNSQISSNPFFVLVEAIGFIITS